MIRNLPKTNVTGLNPTTKDPTCEQREYFGGFSSNDLHYGKLNTRGVLCGPGKIVKASGEVFCGEFQNGVMSKIVFEAYYSAGNRFASKGKPKLNYEDNKQLFRWRMTDSLSKRV